MDQHRFEVDPNKAFKEHTPWRLLDSLGVLPTWAAECALDATPFKQGMEELYGFGPLGEMKGQTYTDTMVLQYPEDPDMQPVAVLKTPAEECWFYTHAIVCFKNVATGETFTTRMD